MSYLVGALNKAERERHARQAQDTGDIPPGTVAPKVSRAGPWLWLFAILVAANVALAIHVWRPGGTTSAAPSHAAEIANKESPIADKQSAPTVHRTSAAHDGADAPIPAASKPSKAAAGTRGETPLNDDSSGGQDNVQPSQTGSRSARHTTRHSADHASAHGQVIHAKAPLTAGGQAPSARNLPEQSDIVDAPQITINGQLYSTVPGRSFILVTGQRYREGQRLDSGPAIERIEPNGATLRYHGHRYHVPGPG